MLAGEITSLEQKCFRPFVEGEAPGSDTIGSQTTLKGQIERHVTRRKNSRFALLAVKHGKAYSCRQDTQMKRRHHYIAVALVSELKQSCAIYGTGAKHQTLFILKRVRN